MDPFTRFVFVVCLIVLVVGTVVMFSIVLRDRRQASAYGIDVKGPYWRGALAEVRRIESARRKADADQQVADYMSAQRQAILEAIPEQYRSEAELHQINLSRSRHDAA